MSELKMEPYKDDENKWRNERFTPEFKAMITENIRHILNCNSIDVIADLSDNAIAGYVVQELENFIAFNRMFSSRPSQTETLHE